MSEQTTPALEEALDEIHQKLSDWESEIDRVKSPVSTHAILIGKKGTAVLLYHSAALQISRFGAYLLKESLGTRRSGMLFGLTRRPMIESYTRALWLEFIADNERIEQIMTRDTSDYNILSGKKNFPSLNQMWDSLRHENILCETVNWLQKNRTWWNDSTHIGPNAVYKGWSNLRAEYFHDDQRVIGDLHTIVEIGTQSAGRFFVVQNGGVDDSDTTRIHREGEQLREKIKSLEN